MVLESPCDPLMRQKKLVEQSSNNIYCCLTFKQQALEERSSLQSLNSQLQHKLAEYFKKKKVNTWLKCYKFTNTKTKLIFYNVYLDTNYKY